MRRLRPGRFSISADRFERAPARARTWGGSGPPTTIETVVRAGSFDQEATSMAEQGFRITYATMSADNEELHKAYDRGIEVARSWLGKRHPFYVNGEARQGSGTKEERSPIDHDLVIGEFAQATGEDVRDAVAAATAFAPAWATTPWKERVALVRRAADLISERRSELAALMAIEVGKNRLEALGDVEESTDLL